MLIVNANPIVNACLRIVQNNQTASIAAVLTAQTETLPSGISNVTSLPAIVAWEKDPEIEITKTPCLTVVAQTNGEGAGGTFNEGQKVRHRIEAGLYWFEDQSYARLAQAYLYGQVLFDCLFERATYADFSAVASGSTHYRVVERDFVSLLYDTGAAKDRRGFVGAASLVFDLTVLATR